MTSLNMFQTFLKILIIRTSIWGLASLYDEFVSIFYMFLNLTKFYKILKNSIKIKETLHKIDRISH